MVQNAVTSSNNRTVMLDNLHAALRLNVPIALQ